jgi:protein RecA
VPCLPRLTNYYIKQEPNKQDNYHGKKTNSTSNLSADKAKAVEAAIAQIEKNYGKGSIMALGSQPVQDIPVIPTGCIQLDMALGVGGFPRGRIIEIYGPESSGKTTLTLHAIAEAQKLGGVAAFIDAEHAFDAVYARKLGVDIESLLVSQPDTGEQALDIAETLVRSGAIDIIVIDSVAALVPQAEINGEMGDNHVGLQARLMSQASANSPVFSPSPTPACCSSTSSA